MKQSRYYGGSNQEVVASRQCQAAREQASRYGFTIRRERRGKETVLVITPGRPPAAH